MLVLACALSALGVTVFSNIALFIAFSVIVYAGYSVSVPVLQSMVAGLAKPAQKNLVMGFFNATQSLGSIAGSLTAGFIYSVHVKLPFVCTFVIYGLGVLAAIGYMTYKGKSIKNLLIEKARKPWLQFHDFSGFLSLLRFHFFPKRVVQIVRLGSQIAVNLGGG